MHYKPSTDEIFDIIIQLSRFFKEFGDFETYITPKFRHPPIKANESELSEIGLLKEI